MEGRTLPEQVADEVVQARDRLLVGDPFGDPPVVRDLRVDLLALLSHAPATRPRPMFPLSAKHFARREPWQKKAARRRPVLGRLLLL